MMITKKTTSCVSCAVTLLAFSRLNCVQAEKTEEFGPILLVPSSEYVHYKDWYLSGAPGNMDLQKLVFTGPPMETSVVQAENETQVVDLAVFYQPDECYRSQEGCDWTTLGVGAKGEDETVHYCCSNEASSQGLCDKVNRLILDKEKFRGHHRFINMPATRTKPGNGPVTEMVRYGKIQLDEPGDHVLVLTNCNEGIGRDITVEGPIVVHPVQPEAIQVLEETCGLNLAPLLEVKDDMLAAVDQIFPLLDSVFGSVSITCSSQDNSRLVQALDGFQQCSGGFDLKEFIEVLPSALAGNLMQCGTSFTHIMEQGGVSSFLLKQQDDLPGLAQCQEAVYGPNLYGDFLRKVLFSPQVMCTCAATLLDALPDCTMDLWPIPLVGSWIKAATCLVDVLVCEKLDSFCEAELLALDALLPNVKDEDADTSTALDCDDFFSSLAETRKTKPLLLSLPKPFLGAPIPDACEEEVGKTPAFANKAIIDRYNQFRKDCLVFGGWEGWTKSSSSRAKTETTNGGVNASLPVAESRNDDDNAVHHVRGGGHRDRKG